MRASSSPRGVEREAERQVVAAAADVADIGDGAAEDFALDAEVPLVAAGHGVDLAELGAGVEGIGEGGGAFDKEGIGEVLHGEQRHALEEAEGLRDADAEVGEGLGDGEAGVGDNAAEV
jgi:hypothetical protein